MRYFMEKQHLLINKINSIIVDTKSYAIDNYNISNDFETGNQNQEKTRRYSVNKTIIGKNLLIQFVYMNF